jgi:hypothetical protein
VVTFNISARIKRPVDIVEAALSRPDNFPFWTKNLERFEVVSGTAMAPGAIGRLHYNENGRRYVLEDRLIEVDPGQRYVSKVSGEAIEARVETNLRSLGDATDVSINWSGKARKFPLSILLPLLRRRMAARAQQELDIFAQLVETKGADFSAAGVN